MQVQGHVGWTPLFRFVSIGSKDIVNDLIQRGAKVDIANVVGDVPLHMAASDDAPELVFNPNLGWLLMLRTGSNISQCGHKCQFQRICWSHPSSQCSLRGSTAGGSIV